MEHGRPLAGVVPVTASATASRSSGSPCCGRHCRAMPRGSRLHRRSGPYWTR
jgi:hypothetical protein